METPSEKYVVKGRNGHLFGVFDDKKEALEYSEGCMVGVGAAGKGYLPLVFVAAEVFIVKHNPVRV